MKESYREGVASHPGPQPCEGGREAALEAWERGIRRQGIQQVARSCFPMSAAFRSGFHAGSADVTWRDAECAPRRRTQPESRGHWEA